MREEFSRSAMNWGQEFQQYLCDKSVIVFGIGGVGGYALEAIARSGVKNITIVDFDTVSKSNINRQLIALNSTIGRKKTDCFKDRLFDINPDINLTIIDDFVQKEMLEDIYSRHYDYTIDAIDSLKSKIALMEYCHTNNFKIITSFGAGNRMDATKLKVADISEISSNCSFTKNILSKLKTRDITKGLNVVYSSEKARNNQKEKIVEQITTKSGEILEFTKITPASTPIVPAVAGLLMANHLINELYKDFLTQKN